MIEHIFHNFGYKQQPYKQQPKKRNLPLLMRLSAIMFIVVISLTVIFGSGFNYGILDTNYTFDVAITQMPDGSPKVIKIKKWRDYEGEQVQILATDGTLYLLSMNHTVLIKNPRTK